MNCGTLTFPRAALLALHLVVLFSVSFFAPSSWMDKPSVWLTIGMPMALVIASWRRTCPAAGEGR